MNLLVELVGGDNRSILVVINVLGGEQLLLQCTIQNRLWLLEQVEEFNVELLLHFVQVGEIHLHEKRVLDGLDGKVPDQVYWAVGG